MKILAILAVYLFGFGYVCQETTRVEQPKAVATATTAPAATSVTADALEEPMLEVVLDTVEISVVAPARIASAGN